jgi:signal transduction histidine kinase/sensor domain CHASE-containing protein
MSPAVPRVIQVLSKPHRFLLSVSIIRKTQILLALVLVCLLVLLYALLYRVVSNSFSNIEHDTAVHTVGLLKKELLDQQDQIERITNDYAVWDDTYLFLRGEEPEYVERNMVDGTFDSNRLALIIIADNQGVVHYARVRGPGGDLPPDEQAAITDSLLHSVAAFEAQRKDDVASSIMELSIGPTVVGARPVLKSDYSGLSTGILIMARRLDTDLLAEIEDRLSAKVNFYSLDQEPADLVAQASALLQAGTPHVISVEDNTAIHGFTLFRDPNSRPILVGEITQPRTIWAAGHQVISWTLGIFIVAGLVFALALTFVLDHLVLKRLGRLIDRVQQIGAEDGHAQRVYLSGNDELNQLARTINQTLSTVADQRTYLTALHETTLDLLNHQQLDDLLDLIVERARTIIDAPYGELMIREDDVLVVRAATAHRHLLPGDRIGRHELQLAWQACASGQPAAVAGFATEEAQHDPDAAISLHPVVVFPIMSGGASRGVLVLSRAEADRAFTPQEIWKGQLFSQLIALVLENANLYATAQREIAERIEVEQALQRSAHELEAQNAELDAFGHTVAHDLKTPLTTIIGYGQMLQLALRERNLDSLDRDVQMIINAGVKMTTIINELLLLATVRRSGPISYVSLDMGAVVSEVIARMQHTINTANAFVSCPPTWPVARGHASWVEEVWVNYLSNALKYGGTPPQVVLGADPPKDGFVRFWVRDNGPGITSEQQEMLFSAFSRLQPARADGHGLGLSIVSRIIEKLGGSVGVESKIGVGSTFFFTLPVPNLSDMCLNLSDSQSREYVGVRQKPPSP